MGPLDHRFLRQFAAIAEAGSIREAARRLNMTQPPLTQALKAGEERLGVPLFDRRANGMTLTPAGHVLAAEAQRILPRLERAERRVRASARPRPVLRIGFVSAALNEALPRLLRAVLSHGEPTPDLHELTTPEQLDAIACGTLDLGFVHLPIDAADDLHVTSLGRDPLCAALPSSHRLAHARRIGFREIVDEPFVLFPRDQGPSLYAAIERAAVEAGGRLRVVAAARRVHSQLALVAGGLGAGLVTASLTRSMRFEGVSFAKITDTVASLYLELALVADSHSIDRLRPWLPSVAGPPVARPRA